VRLCVLWKRERLELGSHHVETILLLKLGQNQDHSKLSSTRTAKHVRGVVPLQDMAEENEECDVMVAKF